MSSLPMLLQQAREWAISGQGKIRVASLARQARRIPARCPAAGSGRAHSIMPTRKKKDRAAA
ncbi:MAG: hypothetical protein ACRECY_07520 [Phyllobacterium sp.]